MLDLFVDYFLQMHARAEYSIRNDEQCVLQVGNSLLQILSSRATQSDYHLRLYAFRALAVVCKVHPAFRS